VFKVKKIKANPTPGRVNEFRGVSNPYHEVRKTPKALRNVESQVEFDPGLHTFIHSKEDYLGLVLVLVRTEMPLQQLCRFHVFAPRRFARHISSPTSASPTCAAVEWERRRLSWLSTGVFQLPDNDRSAMALLESSRALLAERRATTKPRRIRENNILSALRDPGRLVEFNRPAPLPSIVAIMNLLWQEEAAAALPARGPGLGARR
jgi:hypothetical protein